MKKGNRKGLLWYIVAFCVSLFIIFFIGNKIIPGTGDSKMILTTKGLSHIKKGLDLAGGVRLTYKIDFSKYEEAYTNDATQLLQVKKTAQDIILKNIDDRISTLGVSDYNSYVQKLSDGEYIVVEIGGIQDIDAAKKLIGKTVELEFKVPNENTGDTTDRAERQQVAEDLFAQITKNPEKIEEITSTKGSDDIYYNNFSDVGLDELPTMYLKYATKIASDTATGSIYPELLSGVYHVGVGQNASGELESQSLDGFTIIRYLGKKETTLTSLSYEEVISYAQANELSYKEQTANSAEKSAGSVWYDVANKQVIYNSGTILDGQAGYNIAIYQLEQGANSADAVAAIEKGDAVGTLIDKGWKTDTDIKTIVSTFVYNPQQKVSLYKELDADYVVVINNTKKADESLLAEITIPATTQEEADKMISSMTKKTLYSFEDVFVSSTKSWLPAKDPKTDAVLNGTYFKYASVTQSQTGLPVVSIQFDDQGKAIFCNLTEQLIGKQMAIFVGGKLMTAPVIRDKICGGAAQIDGGFTVSSAKQLSDDLNSGALPAPLLLSHEETVAPSLGQNALNGALVAGGIGLLIVYLVMLLLYGWKKANIALITLIAFLVYLLAIMKLFGVVSSLSGIAAIILSLGMSVDANVLMYERIREERDHGKSMQSAITDGYHRSLPPIRDGNITSGIIGLLLFLVGVGVFKGFGTVMIINMLIILFVLVPLVKELLYLFYRKEK